MSVAFAAVTSCLNVICTICIPASAVSVTFPNFCSLRWSFPFVPVRLKTSCIWSSHIHAANKTYSTVNYQYMSLHQTLAKAVCLSATSHSRRYKRLQFRHSSISGCIKFPHCIWQSDWHLLLHRLIDSVSNFLSFTCFSMWSGSVNASCTVGSVVSVQNILYIGLYSRLVLNSSSLSRLNVVSPMINTPFGLSLNTLS